MAANIGGELLWMCPSLGSDGADLAGLNTPTLDGSIASIAETGHGATKAYSFNGTNQSITIPHHSRFNFGTGDFAISLHCKPNSGSSMDLVHKVLSSGTFAGFTSQRVSGNARFWIYNATGTVRTGRPIAVDTWQHVTFERQSGVARMFVNGLCLADSTHSQDVDNSTVMCIGALAPGGWGGGWFSGLMDDIRVFAKALTSLERGLLSTPAYQSSAGGAAAGFTGIRGVGALGT